MKLQINLVVDDTSTILDFSASPLSLYAQGSVALAWDLGGTCPAGASMSVMIQETTDFTLNVLSSSGQIIGTAAVHVDVAPRLPDWPDASRYWGAIVNAGGAISTYLANHPGYFTLDKWVTDLTVTPVNYTDPVSVAAASAAFAKAKQMLGARGIAMGTYVSGTNVMPAANENRYPYSIVPKEGMPATAKYLGAWPGQIYRQFIDPADSPTRQAHTACIAAEWAKSTSSPPGTVFHFVDNAASLQGGPYGSWADQMTHLHDINALAQSLGARCIFNMSAIVGQISADRLTQLVSALTNNNDASAGASGICLEAPFSDVIRNSPTFTAAAAAQYRQMLDAGLAIVWIGYDSFAGQATPAQLRAFAGTFRKPTDHLYLSRPFFKAPDPAIYNWS